jgi:ribosomal protein L14
MVIDPAGDSDTQQSGRDAWAMGVFGVKPSIDDIGASDVYLLDAEIQRHSSSTATDAAVRMYLRNGVIQKLGVEKIGQSTAEIHIANALRAHGRHVAVDNGALVILKPAKVKKATRIEQALEWPLNNGKIWYSTAISPDTIQRIKDEMEKFPFWHDDGLDIMAYLYDILKDFRFARDQKRTPLRYNHRGIA